MKKYKILNIAFLKKNFKVKNFCKELDYLVDLKKTDEKLWREMPEISRYIVYYSFFNKVAKFNTVQKVGNETKDDIEFEQNYSNVDEDYFSEETFMLRELMFDMLCDGVLFEYLSDNFKLIYHFPIWQYETLVFSKFNKRYYHFSFFPEADIETGYEFPDVLKASHRVENYFDKKISKKQFFDKILDEFRDKNSGAGGLIKGRDDEFFEDRKNLLIPLRSDTPFFSNTTL